MCAGPFDARACGVVRLIHQSLPEAACVLLQTQPEILLQELRSPMRGIYRMYILCKRFLLHYTRTLARDGLLDPVYRDNDYLFVRRYKAKTGYLT